MKRYINFKKALFLVMPLLVILGMESCKKDNEGGKGAPTITRVRTVSKVDTVNTVHRITLDSSSTYGTPVTVPFDSTTTTGKLSNLYAIIGTNLSTASSLTINGVPVYFNPALVTDNSIIFTVPINAPWAGTQPNKLTVTTKYGSVDYKFSVQQPAATLTSFSPLAGGEGDIVTIVGTDFDGVSAVTFDKVPAQIVGTPTKTQIQVKVPAGIVQAYIYVTTPGGTTKSVASFGFRSLIYDDALKSGWGSYTGYNSTLDFSNTEHPKRGPNAIKTTFANGYGALQIGYGGVPLDVAKLGLTAIKVSIYGGNGTTDGQAVQVVISGDYNHAFQVKVAAGKYTDFTIPLSSLGNPATINEFTIQGLGVTVPSTIYVDDIGFI